MSVEWVTKHASQYYGSMFVGGLDPACTVLYGHTARARLIVQFFVYTNAAGGVTVECHTAGILENPPTYTASSYEEAQAKAPTVGVALLKLKGLI